VSHSAETLNKLNLPAQRSTHHINTFSASSKTDVTGNFVKYRIGELQKSIQTLLIEFPVVVNLPLSQDFFEVCQGVHYSTSCNNLHICMIIIMPYFWYYFGSYTSFLCQEKSKLIVTLTPRLYELSWYTIAVQLKTLASLLIFCLLFSQFYFFYVILPLCYCAYVRVCVCV
jgi:hypothetical protein